VFFFGGFFFLCGVSGFCRVGVSFFFFLFFFVLACFKVGRAGDCFFSWVLGGQ